MAGSFEHVAKLRDGKLHLRYDLIENMRDAGQAIEEMFDMLEYLSGSDQSKLFEAHKYHCMKRNGHFNSELWDRADYLIEEKE